MATDSSDSSVVPQSSRAHDGVKIQGIPLRTVMAKTAYLSGILFAAFATAGVTATLLQSYGWKLGTGAQ